MPPVTRRHFLATGAAALAGLAVADDAAAEPVIDIHQHTDYMGRTDPELIAHQRKMGVSHTVLLPAGRFFGLEAACSGNDRVMEVAAHLPHEYSFFANEVPYLSDAREVIRGVLRAGGARHRRTKIHGRCRLAGHRDRRGTGAGVQRAGPPAFPIWPLQYELRAFSHGSWRNIPNVAFIGHAQTFWANIDAQCDQKTLYPVGPVTPGGLTDKYLTDYPNIYGDLSAGSALGAVQRDEEHFRGFIARHANKLMFGSDCSDRVGAGEKCSGSQMLAAIRRLSPSKEIERKLLYENAKRLLKLPL